MTCFKSKRPLNLIIIVALTFLINIRCKQPHDLPDVFV